MAWPRRCAVRALEALKWLRHSGGLENPTRWVGAGAISVRRLQMETSVLVFLVWLAVALRGSGPRGLEVAAPLRRPREPDPLGRGRRHLGPPPPDGNQCFGFLGLVGRGAALRDAARVGAGAISVRRLLGPPPQERNPCFGFLGGGGLVVKNCFCG